MMSSISLLDEDFSQLSAWINDKNPSKIFILVDENTHEFCLPTLLGNLAVDIPFEIIEVEAGEEQKNIQTAVHLWDILTDFRADRHSLLLTLGGGVLCDLGGFVASTYKRGTPFVHIPTTLLAMVDASIGGKTGIDHQFLKNLIGTFALPEQIFLYPQFLETLPQDQIRSGFAEMLKHGLIVDENHWNALISGQNIDQLIGASAEIKQNIVSHDFQERNLRKILNFGHTFGHAFESLFLKNGSPIRHGDAVAMGMICEAYLSFIKGLLSQEKTLHIIQNIRPFFPYLSIASFSDEEVLEMMLQDKKNTHGRVHFSLLKDIGEACFDFPVSLESILNALEFYRDL